MFDRIVVGTDGSDTAKEAVRQAGQLAADLGSTLSVVSAFSPVSDDEVRKQRKELPDDIAHEANPKETVNAILDNAETVAKDRGASDVESHAREGDAADAILDVAEETNADLIVVGNKGMTGARRFLLGSVPNKISHHAPCSVMIIRTS